MRLLSPRIRRHIVPQRTAHLIIVSCLLTAFSALPTGKVQGAEPAAPKNVVFIMADDLGWGELGCYGQEKIPTPNIDRLAADGMRFTQHYSGAPVCAPARCVLMTGKHLGHAEVRTNLSAPKIDRKYFEGQCPLSAEAFTMAQAFKKAGFATGAMGKWGLGPVGSTGDPNLKGFDLFFGYNCQGVAHSFYPPYLWRNNKQITINEKPIPGRKPQPTGEVKLDDWIGETYAPKLMVAEAEKFISDHKDGRFFLYLPFTEPHVAMHPPRESVEKFPEEWDSNVYRGLNGYLPHPRPRAGYAAMINDLDNYVGRVMKALEEAGVADETLVIFTSDNGTTHPGRADKNFHIGGVDAEFFNSTAGLRGYKGSVYEGGLRVPMIVRMPGVVKPGEVNDTPCYFADWFPTLCDAAGLEKPVGLDGESLWSTITGREHLKDRNAMVWVFPSYGGQVAVRTGDFKIVRTGLDNPKPNDWEVFNIEKDRNEQHDLSASRADLIAQAKTILKDQVAENERFHQAIPGVNAPEK